MPCVLCGRATVLGFRKKVRTFKYVSLLVWCVQLYGFQMNRTRALHGSGSGEGWGLLLPSYAFQGNAET